MTARIGRNLDAPHDTPVGPPHLQQRGDRRIRKHVSGRSCEPGDRDPQVHVVRCDTHAEHRAHARRAAEPDVAHGALARDLVHGTMSHARDVEGAAHRVRVHSFGVDRRVGDRRRNRARVHVGGRTTQGVNRGGRGERHHLAIAQERCPRTQLDESGERVGKHGGVVCGRGDLRCAAQICRLRRPRLHRANGAGERGRFVAGSKGACRIAPQLARDPCRVDLWNAGL